MRGKAAHVSICSLATCLFVNRQNGKPCCITVVLTSTSEARGGGSVAHPAKHLGDIQHVARIVSILAWLASIDLAKVTIIARHVHSLFITTRSLSGLQIDTGGSHVQTPCGRYFLAFHLPRSTCQYFHLGTHPEDMRG